MINMVDRYVEMLTPGHIKQFAYNEQVPITDAEVNIVYNTIKTRYKDIIGGDYDIINSLQNKVSPQVYNKIIELYFEGAPYEAKVSRTVRNGGKTGEIILKGLPIVIILS